MMHYNAMVGSLQRCAPPMCAIECASAILAGTVGFTLECVHLPPLLSTVQHHAPLSQGNAE